MNEWQTLAYDLAHCRTLRALISDEQAIRVVDELIGDIENHIAELDERLETADPQRG
jgi:hypothetical protein